MEDRSIIIGVSASTLMMLNDMYQRLIPALIFSIVLIIVDMRFGLAASRARGEEIRCSKSVRRSINKFVDYLCWLALAGIFGHNYGQILGIPVLASLIMLVIYGVEITSCFNNYFESRGIKKKINIFKLFGRKELENVLEDIPDGNSNNQKDKKNESC